MTLPSTDDAHLVERHRVRDRRRAVLLALLVAFVGVPAAIAFTRAAMTPDPLSGALFGAGVGWLGLGVAVVFRRFRRRRRERPCGRRDRLASLSGGLVVIAFGLLLAHLATGAVAAAKNEPGEPWPEYLRVRVLTCEQGSIVPGLWWDCETGAEPGRRSTTAQFTPADRDEPVPVLYDPARGYSRLDVERYGVASGVATGLLVVGAVVVLVAGVLRMVGRVFASRAGTVAAPPAMSVRPRLGASAKAALPRDLPQRPDGVPEDALPLSVYRPGGLTPSGVAGLGWYLAAGITYLLSGTLVAWWAAFEPTVVFLLPGMAVLLAAQIRSWYRVRDGHLDYWVHGRFLYLRGTSGITRADLHDPRVRFEWNPELREFAGLRLALPGRPVPQYLPLTEDKRRRPDEDLWLLAAVLERSPSTAGLTAAMDLRRWMNYLDDEDRPEVPGLDAETTPSPPTHVERRPVLAVLLAVVLGFVLWGTVAWVEAVGARGLTAGLMYGPAALLAGPLGYAAVLALTWGAPPRHVAGGVAEG